MTPIAEQTLIETARAPLVPMPMTVEIPGAAPQQEALAAARILRNQGDQ
jgi:hypothetical protein